MTSVWAIKQFSKGTGLWEGVKCWMTDQPHEQKFIDQWALAMHGVVAVAGLGLGLAISALVKLPVEKIIVIEKSSGVIDLWPTSPYYTNDTRISVIHGDAALAPIAKCDSAWLDIWPTAPTEVEWRSLATAYAAKGAKSVVVWPRGSVLTETT